MPTSNDGSESGVPLSESNPLSMTPNPQSNSTLKRKRNEAVPIENQAIKKKRKHQAVPADADLDLSSGINNAIARMDNRMLADHVAQQIKRFGRELSLVELEDRYIPGKAPYLTASLSLGYSNVGSHSVDHHTYRRESHPRYQHVGKHKRSEESARLLGEIFNEIRKEEKPLLRIQGQGGAPHNCHHCCWS